MKHWFSNPYLSLFGNIAALFLVLFLGWMCFNAVFTGEIKFSKSTRWIRLESDPTVFWLAFWFQFGLAVLGVAATHRSIRKDIRAIRENRARRKNV